MNDLIGQTILHYKILEKLGEDYLRLSFKRKNYSFLSFDRHSRPVRQNPMLHSRGIL